MTPNVDILFLSPTKDQLQIIRNELNEDIDRSAHLENLLHTWINCQPHFPKKYDKRIIRSFLRNCKYNMDKVKARLEYNFTIRHLYKEIFSRRSTTDEDILGALNTVAIVPLPNLTENCNRVTIYGLKDTDPSGFDPYAISKLFFMLYDMALTCHHPIAGDIAVFDGTGVTPNHFVKLLTLIKIVTPILREAYAIRLKEIHIVNAPPLLDKVLSVIKPILHQKVRNTFITHSSNTSLCTYFGEEILPSNYGGKCKSVEELMKDLREIFNNSEEWFAEQESVKITEAVPKKIDNKYFKDFNIEGSFRTLQID